MKAIDAWEATERNKNMANEWAKIHPVDQVLMGIHQMAARGWKYYNGWMNSWVADAIAEKGYQLKQVTSYREYPDYAGPSTPDHLDFQKPIFFYEITWPKPETNEPK